MTGSGIFGNIGTRPFGLYGQQSWQQQAPSNLDIQRQDVAQRAFGAMGSPMFRGIYMGQPYSGQAGYGGFGGGQTYAPSMIGAPLSAQMGISDFKQPQMMGQRNWWESYQRPNFPF